MTPDQCRAKAEEIAARMVNAIPTEIDRASISIGPPTGGDEAIMESWSLYVLVPTEQSARRAEREIRGWIADALTTALSEVARVPEGHVRTPDGVDRKVLGTLPLTADGCVVGLGCTIWNARMTGIDGKRGIPQKISDHTLWGDSRPGESPAIGAVIWPQAGRPNTWYSTREAAECAGGGA